MSRIGPGSNSLLNEGTFLSSEPAVTNPFLIDFNVKDEADFVLIKLTRDVV